MGVGFVGGAVRNYFEDQGLQLFLYDPGKQLGSLQEVNQAEVIFICVPTPYHLDIGFNLSYIEDACQNLEGEKVAVLKSTVVPGTTESLQRKYPRHKFLFNPEFLVESRANEDMLHPDRQIVGYTEQSKDWAETILSILPKAHFEKIMRSKEAEMVKYFGNTFLSVKVIFACEMYKLCQNLGIGYEVVKDAASADPRIGPSHLDAMHGGYLGYGGKCFPKDMRALIQFADRNGIDLKLHKTAEEINNELMKAQGIEDPETFSKKG